jgi:hypothetical protein
LLYELLKRGEPGSSFFFSRVKNLKNESMISSPSSDVEIEREDSQDIEEEEEYKDDGMNFREEEDQNGIQDDFMDKEEDRLNHEKEYSVTESLSTHLLEDFLKDSKSMISEKDSVHRSSQNMDWLRNELVKQDLVNFILHDEQFLRDFHDFALDESGFLTKLTEHFHNHLISKEEVELHLNRLDIQLLKKMKQIESLRLQIEILQKKLHE